MYTSTSKVNKVMNLRAVYFIEKAAQVGLNPRPSALCILVFRCSWWHSRQANDVIDSEVFLVKIRIIKVFLCRGEPEHTQLVSRCMCWQKLITHTQTHACMHAHTPTSLYFWEVTKVQ